LKSPWYAEYFESLSAEFDGAGCKINSNVVRSILCKLDAVGPHAASNFENALPSKTVKLCNHWNMPFTTQKSLPRDLFEVLASVRQERKAISTFDSRLGKSARTDGSPENSPFFHSQIALSTHCSRWRPLGDDEKKFCLRMTVFPTLLVGQSARLSNRCRPI